MGTFKLSTGDTYDVPSHDGKYARILIERIYLDGYSEDLEMKEKFKDVAEKKIVLEKDMYDFETDVSFKVKDTYIIAENIDNNLYELTDDYNGNFSSNTKVSHKVQLDFNEDGWKKRIFIDWDDSGSSCTNFIEFVSNISDFLDEFILSNDLKSIGVELTNNDPEISEEELTVMMYTDYGEFENRYLSLREFKNSLINIKLVNFERGITN